MKSIAIRAALLALTALAACVRSDVVSAMASDPAAWTALHKVTPLYGSLNPADRAERLSSLPQRTCSAGRTRTSPPG